MVKSSNPKIQAIDSTPMSEIFLPLLISFLVLSTTEYATKLDDVSKAEIESTADGSYGDITQRFINIEGNTTDVQYIFEENQFSLYEIRNMITEDFTASDEVVISGGDYVPHGKVKKLLLFCQNLGLNALEGLYNVK